MGGSSQAAAPISALASSSHGADQVVFARREVGSGSTRCAVSQIFWPLVAQLGRGAQAAPASFARWEAFGLPCNSTVNGFR